MKPKICAGTFLFFLLLASCQKDMSPYALEKEVVYETLDNLQFGCLDTTVQYYFKGTINNQVICYGDYTNDATTGKYFANNQLFNLSIGTSTDKSNFKGNLLQFGFQKDRDFTKDAVIHSLIIQSPVFKLDSLKGIAFAIDSLIKLGNLPIRSRSKRDTYENYKISIELEIKNKGINSKNIFPWISTDEGTVNSNNYLRCKEKIKLGNKGYAVKFDINCDLYCNFGSKYYGNLVGEMVFLIRTD